MPRITIDGQEIEVEKETTILKAARSLGIDIPTLCYHEALEAYGACRLCVVEAEAGGRTRIVTSCNYPVREDGLIVRTDTERILRIRRMIIELLLARCPEAKIIQELAEKLGVKETRFPKQDEDCILCGLCVRVCNEVIGRGAISFVGRGIERKVETPFEKAPDECIGCGACALICPTGAIKIEDALGVRKIERWHATYPLARCELCGRYFAAVPHLEHLKTKTPIVEDIFQLCPDCRAKEFSRKLVEVKEGETKLWPKKTSVLTK